MDGIGQMFFGVVYVFIFLCSKLVDLEKCFLTAYFVHVSSSCKLGDQYLYLILQNATCVLTLKNCIASVSIE